MRTLTALLDGNEREIRRLLRIVERINGLEPALASLSDAQLGELTFRFRDRLARGESLDALLPEAFAVVREAARRTLGKRPHDVQLLGGIVLLGQRSEAAGAARAEDAA